MYEELAARHVNIYFLKVDVDESPDVDKTISMMPTFQVFKSGFKVDEWSSGQHDKLKAKIIEHSQFN